MRCRSARRRCPTWMHVADDGPKRRHLPRPSRFVGRDHSSPCGADHRPGTRARRIGCDRWPAPELCPAFRGPAQDRRRSRCDLQTRTGGKIRPTSASIGPRTAIVCSSRTLMVERSPSGSPSTAAGDSPKWQPGWWRTAEPPRRCSQVPHGRVVETLMQRAARVGRPMANQGIRLNVTLSP
jgi:hypothetical protein